MTPEVYEWVKEVKRTFDLKGKVLDIGSMNITGCVRDLFEDYIGLDIRPGLNVDVVADAHSLPYANEYFDVVCCLEMLEHDSNFFQTIAEIQRVLKRDGYLLLSARANGYEAHDFPHDYWRFTEDAFRLLLSPFRVRSVGQNLLGIYGWAQK
jgi:SAM-dependent methyltransferase